MRRVRHNVSIQGWQYFCVHNLKTWLKLIVLTYIYNVIYMCGTEGRGTRSHHRVCWPYHASKHMAHSIQRRTLENMTEMTILVFYCSSTSCAWQTLPVWKHNGHAMLCICTASCDACGCETASVYQLLCSCSSVLNHSSSVSVVMG